MLCFLDDWLAEAGVSLLSFLSSDSLITSWMYLVNNSLNLNLIELERWFRRMVENLIFARFMSVVIV